MFIDCSAYGIGSGVKPRPIDREIMELERQRDDIRDLAMVLGKRRGAVARKQAAQIQRKIARLKRRG